MHEWASLGSHETKERKSSAQPLKVRKIVGEPKKSTRLGYLGIPRSLGSSGHIVKPG